VSVSERKLNVRELWKENITKKKKRHRAQKMDDRWAYFLLLSMGWELWLLLLGLAVVECKLEFRVQTGSEKKKKKLTVRECDTNVFLTDLKLWSRMSVSMADLNSKLKIVVKQKLFNKVSEMGREERGWRMSEGRGYQG
jgi:hypothetical protein